MGWYAYVDLAHLAPFHEGCSATLSYKGHLLSWRAHNTTEFD